MNVYPISNLISKSTPPAGSPQELIDQHAEFQERYRKLSENRANVAKQKREFETALDDPGYLDRVHDADPENLSGLIGLDAERLRESELRLLQEELALRVAMERFLSRQTAESRRAARDAVKARQDFERKLIDMLVATGDYDDPEKGRHSPFAVAPMFFHRNRTWRRLTEAENTTRQEANEKLGSLNRDAIVRLRATIRESGRKLAGLPATT